MRKDQVSRCQPTTDHNPRGTTVLPRWTIANYPRTLCMRCHRIDQPMWNKHFQERLCEDCARRLYRIQYRASLMRGDIARTWSDEMNWYPWPHLPTPAELQAAEQRVNLRSPAELAEIAARYEDYRKHPHRYA